MTEVKRDRYSRYLITPPGGGEPVAHTRVTTIADVLDDRHFLEKYLQRMVAHGLSKRDDLAALAAATPLSEKKALNKICSDAIEAAGGSGRANKGTAVHGFTERIDRGEELDIPAPWDADVAAYKACLERHNIEIDPERVERIAVCTDLPEPVAGTIDRIVGWGDETFIADLKTGKSLDFSWRKIAVQLGIYVHAATLYDPETDSHEPMPHVNQEAALVFHLPAGEGRCEAYMVDIQEGWRAANASLWVREWRKRDDLVSRLEQPVELQEAA